MTVLIFRYSRLDLSLVQLTNIFMSDLNLPRCSDSSFIRVGQDTARQLPHVFDVVATIRQRSLRRYFWAALCFFFFFFGGHHRFSDSSAITPRAPRHSYQRSGSSICLPETLLARDVSLISAATVSPRRTQGRCLCQGWT